MTEWSQTFEAVNSNHFDNFWIALAVDIIALLACLLFYRRRVGKLSYNMSMLFSMFSFFVFIIGVSTSFFSWMAFQKATPVRITSDSIETPFGKAPYANIIKAEMEDDLLIIEEKNKKVHVISKKDFAVEKIYEALRESVDRWKAKQ